MSLKITSPVRGTWDVYSLFFLVVIIAIFTFQLIGQTYGVQTIGETALIMTLAGLILGVFWSTWIIKPKPRDGVIIDITVTYIENVKILYAVMGSTIAILIVNASINYFFPYTVALTADPVNTKLNAMNMGGAEEIFFRYWWATFFISIWGPLFGIIAQSGLWTIFHLWRYAPLQANLTTIFQPPYVFTLIIVFVAGIILGLAYYWSGGRLSVTIIPHMLINAVATPKHLITPQAILLMVLPFIGLMLWERHRK